MGSSDAPSLVGVGFADAAKVYRDKTEPVNDHLPESGYLARGLALEPVVAARYEQVMGVAIINPVRYENGVPCFRTYDTDGQDYSITYHPERPWQSASLDRRRADNGNTISLKTTAFFGDEWGEQGSADVPEVYRVQSQHECGVTQTKQLDLAVLAVGDWQFRVFRLDFDPDYFDWLTIVESRFWHEHVMPRVPPPADWDNTVHPPVVHTLRPGTIDLGDDIAVLLDQRARIGRIKDEADAEHRRLTEQVQRQMGDSERAVAGRWKLRRSFIKGGSVSYNRKDYVKLTISGGRVE